MDVKYIPADWERMRSSLKGLIGKGPYGKGIIDELKEISSNFEKAEDTISKYDSDGVISFTHTNRENTYQGLFEDFDVLYRFTGKVGDIVDQTIDAPFYKDIDDFVVAIRDLSPLNYTTKNRIGATETIHIPQSYQTFEMDKKEVSLDDLFNGDNFYGKQMALEYEAWKEMNVDADEDITQADYQLAALNTRAFGYESIRDTQENKEFWVNIAALVVIVGAALVFPPAGIALGAAYGVAELSSAVSGKDWVSGRELGTGERWFRGALAPLDIIPGAMAVKKFSGAARTVSFADDLGQLGKTTSLTNKAQSSIQKVNDLALTAGKQATARLKHVDALIMEREAKILAKLADGAIGTARVVDETVDNTINFITDVIPNLKLVPADGVVHPHLLEDLTKGALSKFEGLNIGGGGVPKGAGNTSKVVNENGLNNIDDFINGTKKFDDVIDDYVKLYSEKIILNKTWSWNKSLHGGANLTARQKRIIKEKAVTDGLIPDVKVIKVDGMRYGFADFKSAGLVVEAKKLPEKLWLLSDEEQFKWLDNTIGGKQEGMTWHHTEIPGKMELVPFGIHNITIHNGGRSTGMWADAPR